MNLRLFWPFLITLYLLTRLVNLGIIPIFTDEAIYTYWAQVALHDPANRFISLEDGKQPLFIWLAAIFQKFVADPLIASRMVSVFAGAGSVIGIYLLAKTLFDQKVAQLAALLYVVLPFTLIYDRLALFDSLLTMLGIFSVFLAVKIAQNPKLDLALINGAVIGFAMITKSSANFFLYLLPVSLLFFNFRLANLAWRIFKWLGLTAVTFLLAQVIYNSLRLSPLFYLISRKNLEFIRNLSEVLNNPLANFFGNLNSIIRWLADYNGSPLTILAVSVIIWGLIKKEKSIILLSVYILAPFVATLFFNKVLYPRFALFYFPYLIILAAYAIAAIVNFKAKYAQVTILVLAVSLWWPLFSSFKLLTDPPGSKISQADKFQYLNDWPAGYGVAEVVEILKGASQNQKVFVGTEGTFGLLPYALQVYFYGDENIEIVGYWPVRAIPSQVLEAAKTRKTYFVFNESQNLPDLPNNPYLKLVGKYQKGHGHSFMRLYEIIP